jgi:dsDNA-specific endonuclease/ATPase MutS2
MIQGKKKEFKPGDWVFVMNTKGGEVVRGRAVKYVGETEGFFLVEVPVMMKQGVEWVVRAFDKGEWTLVRRPE